ncbi:hypothetical protein HELRODRAFT_165046 [Helobdella robusta]|uniref:Endonuclease/exonuclease/phosphatase domain-containing protein n=1 Tax=Helobdella robusta TaxID=6412 RepID=T1EW70_HELRO|nr:hypothetical protein HELRODRAFT_165046 [Helobdella robusta]ESN92910.1 hypothetical protein HELRODRAFT_165046 [Helobdella robusta]
MNGLLKNELKLIKEMLNNNSAKLDSLDRPDSKLSAEINTFKSDLKSFFATVVGQEVKKNIECVNLEVKTSQRSSGKMANCEAQKLTDEGVVDERASRRMIHVTAQKLTMKNYNDLKIGLGLLNIRSIMSKYEMVCDIIRGEFDILVLTETWHGSSDEFAVRRAMPPGYKFVDYVRPHDPYHGGIIIYFKKEFIYKPVELPAVITFEAVAIKLRVNKSDFILLSIYRPGLVPPSPSFFSELV